MSHRAGRRSRVAWDKCRISLVLLVLLALLPSCRARSVVKPFVAGLNQPRGLAFDDSGDLFVAEAGFQEAAVGGKNAADTNHSGRILRVTPAGEVTVVLDGLPFTYYEFTGDVGPTDVVAGADGLYMLTGEGYDDQLSRRVLRHVPGGSPQVVASIFSFALGMSSTLDLEIGSFASNPYAMIAEPGSEALLVADAASGLILRVTTDGQIRTFVEFPNMPPLGGMAYGPDGRLYIAHFSSRPHTTSSGQIWAVGPAGELALVVQGLTMPIDVAFDGDGLLYVLEFGGGGWESNQRYPAGNGRLVRMEADGEQTVVLDELNYPTAMAFSQAYDLYISVGGAFTAEGQGEIRKVPCEALGTPEACDDQVDQ